MGMEFGTCVVSSRKFVRVFFFKIRARRRFPMIVCELFHQIKMNVKTLKIVISNPQKYIFFHEKST